MAKLKNEVQTFIVQRLAMYDTPTQVAAAVRDEFGLEVTRQQVYEYDANRAGQKPGKRWVALFEATRKMFLEDIAAIPSANKSVRVRRLDRMAAAAEDRKNFVLARELYEQIAKEVGDAYVNKNRKGPSGEREDPLHFTFTPEVPPPVGANNRRDDDDVQPGD